MDCLIIFFSVTATTGVLTLMASSDSLNILEEHQKKRIMAFFFPETVTKDDRHQAYQSEIAVGSGGLSGKGYGQSTQKEFNYLPEHQTDFVFSVWAEEWGFWGELGALALFWLWIAQMVNITSVAKDRFGVLIGVGVTAMIFWQTFINIAMVIGLAPVVGITLPLWSYGGSSLLTTLIGMGLLMSVYYHRHVF
jgi:rod shape determining protein RodA